jgi:hypothetical protein
MTAKIIPLGCITRLDLPADRIIDALREADLEGVVVMGYRKEEAGGELYFASSYADGGTVLWLMEQCRRRLLAVSDDSEG